ncbi:MAG: NAD(P)-dependent oxidoreductase [Pseudomonadota bacterium]|nr:NAD(P)-dependent oxidoreductase [Pseudomonadota bacterium]
MNVSQPFRVALSGAFQNDDGTAVFPMFDLSPLTNDAEVEFEYVAGIDGRMTAESLEDFDALVLLLEKFDANSIPKSNRLALIARFGVGFDTVDVEACKHAGIAVGITPNGVRRPVAVSVLTYILALSGKLLSKDALVRGGPSTFAQRADHMGIGLVGKTLGSIGLGNIGAEVFRMCAPFGMNLIAHDPYIDPSTAQSVNVELRDLETVFRESDFLTLNVPLNEETHHLANAARLALMKPSAYLINTSRGPVVDQAALVTALTQGIIAGAGLDVFDPEPPQSDDPLLKLDNVILTPHALCWTDQCFAGMGAQDLEHVFAIKNGEAPQALADPSVADEPTFQRKLEHYRIHFGTQST